MRYFKANITIENGETKYGNLPIGFVLGYENDNLKEAYFCLYENVSIPEDAGIIEIEKSEYDIAVDVVNQLANTKRQVDLERAIQFIVDKNRVISELQDKNLVLTESIAIVYEQQLQSEISNYEAIAELYELILGGIV